MYELIAQEITKNLAPWLWEEFNPKAKSQASFFRSDRKLTRWQLEDLVKDIESLHSSVTGKLAQKSISWSRVGREYFDYEKSSVEKVIFGLEKFLKLSKHRLEHELDTELAVLRKLLSELLLELQLPEGLEIEMGESKFRPKLKQHFLELRAKDRSGAPISKESNEKAWLELRKSGLTSTDAGKLIRLNGQRRTGWRELFQTKLPGFESDFFDSYALGVEREPKVAEWVVANFPEEEFFHNEFTYLSSEDERLMTTPDMVGNFAVCEIKVSSKDLMANLQRYKDQIQWHMMVLDAPVCLFVVENRYDQSKDFAWVDADNQGISALIQAAEEWLEEFAEWCANGDTF